MATPKLRFKEFDGGWTSKKLKDLTDVLRCGVASTPKYVTEGGYPFLSAQNVSRDGEMNYSKVNNISDDFYKRISKTKLVKGDILYSRVGASYGVAAIFDKEEEYGVYVSLTHIRANQNLDNIFLKHFLNSPKARIQAEQGVFQGGGVQNLNVGVVEEFNLAFPSKIEQTKIASFLSTVDEKISQLTQKHQLLSQYKQGMMQNLFSQQIRFKADDGSEFGEWEETSLHTFLCESLIKGSKGNKAKKLTVKLWGKGVIPKNEAFQGSENTQYYKRSAGQLIYGKLDFLNCAFGLIPEYLDGFESTIDAPAFDIDNKIVHPYFLINRFLQKDFYQKNGEEADGSRKAKRINQSVFLAMQIGLPSLEEQTKIANFLSAIDQKIEVVAQQIEQAKTWKKGLLQQMFV